MPGTIDLTRKLLEMELRRELERLAFPKAQYTNNTRALQHYEIDKLVESLLPFIERKIQASGPQRCSDCHGLLPDAHPSGYCPARDEPDYG